MSDLPVCSVIVPSYRSAATIGACLAALLNQDFSQPYEIIVVDSSPDETPDLVRRRFPQVRLIHLAQQTDPAHARNIGAQHARGSVLAFIDSDCTAASDWLARLYAALMEGYEAVGGATANGNGETLVSWAGYMCEFREYLPGRTPRDVQNLSLNNAAYRRDLFEQAGGFPVGYFPQEDQVFHYPLARAGTRIRLDPQIVVAHIHRTDRGAFLHHQRSIGRANAQVLRQLDLPGAGVARRRWLVPVALPALVLLRFIRTLKANWNIERKLVLRQPELAWLIWLGMCWWGLGFLEGAAGERPWSIIVQKEASDARQLAR
jgi:glycosyltransferase involved in cell wall biosynthesis